MMRAVLAIMAFLTFIVSPHVWPWYLIWVLGPAVLSPGWWLSRLSVGMTIAVPFVVPFWWVDDIEGHKDIAALLLHGLALLWMITSWYIERGVPRTVPRAQLAE